MNLMVDYARKIAEASLSIGAIKLSPENPFQWASGYFMPIYNDNRQLLGSYRHRMLIADALAELIGSEGEKVDYLVGITTAGIAPATSAAEKLEIPLVLIEGSEAYLFEHPLSVDVDLECDAIASTSPWAIPFGVATANELELPFMYVREKGKAHGLKQQIEGVPAKGKEVILVDFYKGDSYLENAQRALEEKGIGVISFFSGEVMDRISKVSLVGKTVGAIEDVISRGGSSAKEVLLIRSLGAYCSHCYSGFNYGFPEAEEHFKKLDPPCSVVSCLYYPKLLEVSVEKGYITPGNLDVLKEWRIDPFVWGEKHGFPRKTN